MVLAYKTDAQINGNREKGPDINPYICSQLINNKGTRIQKRRKKSFFNKLYRILDRLTCRRLNWITHYLTLHNKYPLKMD